MERGLRFVAAIVAASICAGPLFWLGLVLLGRSSDAFAILIIPLGAYFTFLPNLIGTAVMTMLGNRLRSARSSFAWIAAGAAGGLAFAVILTGTTLPDPHVAAAMVLTGMACAAICRAFTHWPEETGDAQA
jgi:hypothetical protein